MTTYSSELNKDSKSVKTPAEYNEENEQWEMPVKAVDGADATQGAKADAAQTDHTQTASKMSFIKGILSVINSIMNTIGSAIGTKIILVGGSDGTNARAIKTDTSGNIINVGTAAHDAAASGNPVQIGGVYRSADPALSDGDAGALRLNSKSEAMVQLTGTITPTLTRPNVTTTSSTALASNANRKYAIFVNRNPVDIAISLGGTAVAGQGLYLPANGGSYSMSIPKGNLYTGAITAIHAATGITYVIDIVEGV